MAASNRWPRVSRPASSPRARTVTTASPCSATSPCAGRTQRRGRRGAPSALSAATLRRAARREEARSRAPPSRRLLLGRHGALRSELGPHFLAPGLRRHGKAESGPALEIALRHAPRQGADAADVGSALGDADGAARLEQIEAVRRLQHLLVGGRRELQVHEQPGFALVRGEGGEQELDVAGLEVVRALLDLVLVIDVAIAEAFGPGQLVDAVDTLQVHREPLEAVGDLAGDRLAVDAADLLEVGEPGH